MIVWGTRMYGWCDQVDGLGQVATRFGHLWFIPLIPLESMLVTGETADGWRGVPIPLSLKSILVAWSRAALFIGSLIALFMGGSAAFAVLDHFMILDLVQAMFFLPVSIVSLAAWWGIGRLARRASTTRQAELLSHCGLDDFVREAMRVAQPA